MAIFESVETQARARRRARLAAPGGPVPAQAIASEWQPAPLGRLGELLWTDIDRYLEFVAIARTEPDGSEARREAPRAGRDRTANYLWWLV